SAMSLSTASSLRRSPAPPRDAAARHVERAHPRTAGAGEREGDLGGAAGGVGAIDGGENSANRVGALGEIAARKGNSERPLEAVGDAGDVRAEATARAAGVGDAGDQPVVALLRLLGDGLRTWRPARAGDDLDIAAHLVVRMRRQGDGAGGSLTHA